MDEDNSTRTASSSPAAGIAFLPGISIRSTGAGSASSAMPDLGVTEQEAKHIAAYIYAATTRRQRLPEGP